MTSMTRRALARSATISAGAAIAVPLKTPLARSCTATLQHTRLGAVAYGRICPVHIWPVLRCPPRPFVRDRGLPSLQSEPHCTVLESAQDQGDRTRCIRSGLPWTPCTGFGTQPARLASLDRWPSSRCDRYDLRRGGD